MVKKVNNIECNNNSSAQSLHSEPITANSSDNNELDFVSNQLDSFKESILRGVDERVSSMIDEILQESRNRKLRRRELRQFDQETNADFSENVTDIHTIPKDRTAELPVKVFVMRESCLTTLLEINHIKCIYNIFFTILIMLFLNSVCYDYFVEGRINFGLGTFKSGFDKIHYVFFVWCLEHVGVFTLYYAFEAWQQVRFKLLNKKHLLSLWTYSCLLTFTGSLLVFWYIAAQVCLELDLPFISASVLLLETTRLIMKMYAFVRHNAARILEVHNKKLDSHEHKAMARPIPATFTTYVYFLFAPTLVYRDQYPRNKEIRWRFAAVRFFEVVAIAFLYSYIHECHIELNFLSYCREPLTASAMVLKIFGMFMPSMIILVSGFYLVLHSWLNFTAELLRFGDRMFYKDWWTSTNYGAYYRNWNTVVHDWLYEYVYRDCYMYIFKGSKLSSALMVFFVSALVHDYVLSYALQMFFPVIFVLFGFVGVFLVLIQRTIPTLKSNLFFWFSFTLGNGLMFALYSMEYYARRNCTIKHNGWIDYFVPVLWSCHRR